MVIGLVRVTLRRRAHGGRAMVVTGQTSPILSRGHNFGASKDLRASYFQLARSHIVENQLWANGHLGLQLRLFVDVSAKLGLKNFFGLHVFTQLAQSVRERARVRLF